MSDYEDFFEDEDLSKEERLERLEDELLNARRGLYYRVGLLGILIIAGVFAIFRLGPGFIYFFKFNTPPIDLGDARKVVSSGKRYLNLPSNTYVKVENLIVSQPAKTKTFKYFYSPLFNMIVRTKRPLPMGLPTASNAIIPQGLLFLLQERIVFVSDFTTHFNAQGRLIKLEDFPAWRGGLKTLYGQYIEKLGGHGYILLDGDTPMAHIWDVVAIGGLVIALIFGMIIVFRQKNAVREIEAELNKLRGL